MASICLGLNRWKPLSVIIIIIIIITIICVIKYLHSRMQICNQTTWPEHCIKQNALSTFESMLLFLSKCWKWTSNKTLLVYKVLLNP